MVPKKQEYKEVANPPEIPSFDPFTVYTPSDDTYLFLDALKEDLSAIRALCPVLCVEIG